MLIHSLLLLGEQRNFADSDAVSLLFLAEPPKFPVFDFLLLLLI